MRTLVLTLTLAVAAATSAFASGTLYMGFGANSACATGGTTCLIDPNLNLVNGQYLLSANFSIYNVPNGNITLTSPLLLILGVAGSNDPNLFDSSSITGLTAYNPYVPGSSPTTTYTSSAWQAGSSTFSKAPYAGYFSSSSSAKDVYGFLGLGGGVTNSQNLSNWNQGLLNVGATVPTGYGIYVFELKAAMGPNGLVNVQFQSPKTVPHKTYVLAYGLGSNTPLASPFTKTALQYPEPASWILLSTSGLLLLGARRFRGKIGLN